MTELVSRRIEVAADARAVFDDMYRRGLTDGLPVIPPTEARVREMLVAAAAAADDLIAVVPPEGGPATVEKLAINAVMAGCLPEYFPLVIAAVRAVTAARFNLLGIQTTTNPVAPVLVVNGPIRGRIGIECGRGCMGPGFRANATIGRALRLILLNIGGCPPGDVDKAIHGMPGKFSFCFGELEEQSPWPALHVEQGCAPEDSAVTAFGGQGTQNIYAAMHDPNGIVHMLADGMRCYGNNGYLRACGAPLIVLSPGHARIFAAAGWDKDRIRQELFERTRIARRDIPTVAQLSVPIYSHYAADEMCLLCRSAGDIKIVVAGGPEAYHITYIPSFGTTEPSTARIS
ncbi:MAG: hypothetical protein IT531_20595 [Burkholderiales bacterium]|nr:hypothetical protein [Burkholderiales bacterium]